MARPFRSFPVLIALLLLGLMAALFAALGNWQLNRASQRDALEQALTRAAGQAAVELTATTPPAELQAWRAAGAQGYWLHGYTTLVGSRNLKGRPGWWVLTPLQLARRGAAAPGTPGTAVLVLRGWLAQDEVMVPGADGARQVQADGLAHRLAQDTGWQDIRGELFEHVPRTLELWRFSSREDPVRPPGEPDFPQSPPMVQNINLAEFSQTSGLELLPLVLAREDGPLAHDWPHPPTDGDKNRGYALQWFSFCAIAVIAFAFIAWRALRAARPART